MDIVKINFIVFVVFFFFDESINKTFNRYFYMFKCVYGRLQAVLNNVLSKK